ncbi:hypothetical protein KJ953_03355 [Patescibacteria group bacterium]|nr:hypothetical protein [Patescibacteria group bacterium]MBU1256723.1 hypothetical protein [Patescibacteria group bacterium]MBU1457684.1 hypothetical protein [Patescibacteria group bacterium]
MEGSRPAWVRRYHEHNLGGLGMRFGVEDGHLVVEKFGIRRFASLEDEAGVWKILTNDMELNEETAEEVLSLVILNSGEGSSEA